MELANAVQNKLFTALAKKKIFLHLNILFVILNVV